MTQLAKDAAKSWSSTLRLPKSTFPPRPAAAEIAKYIQGCADDLYKWQSKYRTEKNAFTLHDGPPYANGRLHIGHALNKILKDIICRTEVRKGRRVHYVPGWDCHGLPIELKALDHHGWKKGDNVDPLAIRKAAGDFAAATVQTQMKNFKSWGIMADWEGHWKTMDKDFELRQLSVFQSLAKSGLIYRRHKPVYWSPSSGTALAEAELEYSDEHVSTAALIKFPLVGFSFLQHYGLESQQLYAVIWTTTPWTLPANQAIAVNRNLEYTIARSLKHGLLLLATARLPFAEELIGETLQGPLLRVPGEALVGVSFRASPAFDRRNDPKPLVHADFVSADAGTGLVHCAPGHGAEDYEALQPLIRTGQITVKTPVDGKGCFTEEAAPNDPDILRGRNVFNSGNKTVLEIVDGQGLLIATHDYKHKYPYDWRTKEPIIIRATAQWFADVSSIRDDVLKSLDHVKFHPSTGKSRLTSFIANRSEWCISRQRAWGVPIPALYHNQTGEAILSDSSITHIIDTIKARGIDAWWSDAADDPAWISPDLLQEASASEYRRGMDTMDVWFDSGTSWTQLLKGKPEEKDFLADVYIEGTDQHRGWFQSSLLTHVAYQQSQGSSSPSSAPFRSLITHGFTLDAEGKKMSKSIGNVVSPDEIIQGISWPSTAAPKAGKTPKSPGSLGPDALRLWVGSADFSKDLLVSDTIVKTVHAALHKYRVTFKLLLGALQDLDLGKIVPYDRLGPIDRIALLQLWQVTEMVRAAFENYEFYKAVTAINKWINTDLSSLYIESIKDSLYCDGSDWESRRRVQTVLYHVFVQMQAMLGPLTPILIQETWEHSPAGLQQNSRPPLQRVWEAVPDEWKNEMVGKDLPVLLAVNSAVKTAQERARSEKLMGSSLQSTVAIVLDDSSGERVVRTYLPALTDLFVVSGVGIATKRNVEKLRELFREGTTSAWQKAISQDPSEAGFSLGTANWAFWEDVVTPSGTVGGVIVHEPAGFKCARCWRYVDESTASEREGKICERCENAVKGSKRGR